MPDVSNIDTPTLVPAPNGGQPDPLGKPVSLIQNPVNVSRPGYGGKNFNTGTN